MCTSYTSVNHSLIISFIDIRIARVNIELALTYTTSSHKADNSKSRTRHWSCCVLMCNNIYIYKSKSAVYNMHIFISYISICTYVIKQTMRICQSVYHMWTLILWSQRHSSTSALTLALKELLEYTFWRDSSNRWYCFSSHCYYLWCPYLHHYQLVMVMLVPSSPPFWLQLHVAVDLTQCTYTIDVSASADATTACATSAIDSSTVTVLHISLLSILVSVCWIQRHYN